MTGIASGTPQNGFDLVNHMTMGTYSVGLTKGILFNLHVKGYTMIIEIVICSYQNLWVSIETRLIISIEILINIYT